MPTSTKAKPAVKDTSAHEKDAIAVLRRLVGYETKRTQALKDFAASLILIRKDLNDPAGQTQAYRDAAARIYAAVDIPPDSQSSLQASIRYHIGNVLRDEFTPDELRAAGLSEKTPLERAREARGTGNGTPLPGAAGGAPAVTSETPHPPVNGGVEVHVLPDAVVLAPVNPPKPRNRKEKRDYAERPRPEIYVPADPIVLVGHALDTVRAAAHLPNIPKTEVASLRDLIRRITQEMATLEARLAEVEKAPASKAPARKTTKAA